jgi:hypothetical protein
MFVVQPDVNVEARSNIDAIHRLTVLTMLSIAGVDDGRLYPPGIYVHA